MSTVASGCHPSDGDHRRPDHRRGGGAVRADRSRHPEGRGRRGRHGAERIARNAPLAVAASKQLIKATRGVTDEEFYALQLALQRSVFTSNDAKEGPRAFAEKRSPDWTGT